MFWFRMTTFFSAFVFIFCDCFCLLIVVVEYKNFYFIHTYKCIYSIKYIIIYSEVILVRVGKILWRFLNDFIVLSLILVVIICHTFVWNMFLIKSLCVIQRIMRIVSKLNRFDTSLRKILCCSLRNNWNTILVKFIFFKN